MQNNNAKLIGLILIGIITSTEAKPPVRGGGAKSAQPRKKSLTKRLSIHPHKKDDRADKRQSSVFTPDFPSMYLSEEAHRDDDLASKATWWPTLEQAIKEEDEDAVARLLRLSNRPEDDIVYAALSDFSADTTHESDESDSKPEQDSPPAYQKWSDFRRETLRKGMPSFVNERSPQDGATPLYAAALQGKLAIVRLLLANGADPNLSNEQTGDTPLHGAASLLLIACDKSDFADAKRKGTTIDHLVFTKKIAITQFLLQAGADPNCINKQNATPLHRAASMNHRPDIAHELLQAGAEIDARNSKGHTPYFYATTLHKDRLATFLAEHGATPDIEK